MVKIIGFKLSMSNCSLCCKQVELENPIFDDENANSNGDYDKDRFDTNSRSLCHDILEYDINNQTEIRKLERKLSFCSNCSNMISAVVKKNQDAQNVGRKVEILQRRILREMKNLQGKMLGVNVEMRKIQDVVRNTQTMEMETVFENPGEREVGVRTGVNEKRTIHFQGTEIQDFRKRILSANPGPQEYISSVDSKMERESKTQRIGIDIPTAGDRLTLKTPENDTSCKKIKPQIVDVHDGGNVNLENQFGRHRRDIRGNRNNVKVFDCLFCNKHFSQKTNLERHLLTHIGEKPYHCRHQHCSKSFATKGNLKIHQLTHSNKRPFPCQQCQKRFKCLANLRQHGMGLGHEIGNFLKV